MSGSIAEKFTVFGGFGNPREYDYERYPYGNDVGFLSELAFAGGGVELIGDRLVTLVLSTSSMTRRALRDHVWQHRWQYTFSFLRVVLAATRPTSDYGGWRVG